MNNSVIIYLAWFWAPKNGVAIICNIVIYKIPQEPATSIQRSKILIDISHFSVSEYPNKFQTDRQNYELWKEMTYRGTNCKKNASWGKGKSMYSIIFKTASDLICDLKIHLKVSGLHTQSFSKHIHKSITRNIFVNQMNQWRNFQPCKLTLVTMFYIKKEKRIYLKKILGSNICSLITYLFQQVQHLKYHQELCRTSSTVFSLPYSGEPHTWFSCPWWMSKKRKVSERKNQSYI